jgi:hypothetical protein
VDVPAFDMRFPKQKSKGTKADEHDNHLEKYCGASSHVAILASDLLFVNILLSITDPIAPLIQKLASEFTLERDPARRSS